MQKQEQIRREREVFLHAQQMVLEQSARELLQVESTNLAALRLHWIMKKKGTTTELYRLAPHTCTHVTHVRRHRVRQSQTHIQ